MIPPYMPPLLLTLALAVVGLSGSALAFSFDDMEKLEAAEQQELLKLAHRAARNRDFSQARKYIEQARHKGYNLKAINAAESIYRREYAAYEEQKRREEAEQQAHIEAEQQASRSSDGGAGSINCSRVSKDYALYAYCTTGSCNGFSDNYGLWNLCESNSSNGLSSNHAVWSYLKSGDTNGFSKDVRAWNRAKENASSFAERKRFVIYYLRGYTYGN